jgi:hypothetical protein
VHEHVSHVSIEYLRHLAHYAPNERDRRHSALAADLIEAQQAEIERLQGEVISMRAEVRGFQAESGCWQRWHDAEWALADQLHHALCVSAVRLSYPEVFDALAAYRTARTNGSASATDVGGPS